jgi:hypothetical protein
MKTIIILGVVFVIGLFAGYVSVYGWYAGNPVICVCTPTSGGTEWSGADCPRQIRNELREEYDDMCPSPS